MVGDAVLGIVIGPDAHVPIAGADLAPPGLGPLALDAAIGLGQVRDLKRKTLDTIFEERESGPFVSLRDFATRIPAEEREVKNLVLAGAFVWAITLYDLAQMRMALGLPYLRMAVILGSVAVVALLSALLFETKSLRDVYRLN